jgi:hypothetical protein
VNFTAYPDHFLSLITIIRQKKTKLGIKNQFLPSSRQERYESGGGSDLWICWGKGKGKRRRELGSSERLGECETGKGGDDWTKSGVRECETETKSLVGWGWLPGRVGIRKEKRLWDRDEVKIFTFLILHLVNWSGDI